MKIDSILDDPLVNSSNCHIPCFCGFCEEEGNYFECPGCLREAAYCQGQDDDYYDFCTPCYWQLSQDLITVVIQEEKPNIYINPTGSQIDIENNIAA